MRFNDGQIHPGKAIRETKMIVQDWLSGREINRGTYLDTLIGYESREFLYRVAKQLPVDSQIVEIGCYAGGSTLFLRKGAAKSRSFVYSIDPFDTQMPRQLQEDIGANYLKRVRRGDHSKPSFERVQKNLEKRGAKEYGMLIPGFSVDIAKAWRYGPIDMLFVDGNHDQAKDDYLAWKPHLKNGALLIFDDANQGYKSPHDRVVADVELLLQNEIINHKRQLEILAKVERIVAFRLL